MSAALDDILSDVEAILEVVVEIDSAKRSDGTLKTWYYSTYIRETSGSETPANTPFLPYLVIGGTLGPLSQSLSQDALFSGLASNSPGTLTLLQQVVDNDQLSQLNDYVFAGYPVRVKIGRQSDLYADFELYRTITVNIDPIVQSMASGLQATFQLSSVLDRLLDETLIVRRYIGIPTCAEVLTTTGVAEAAYNAAHDLLSFTVMYKVSISVASASNRNLLQKGTATGNNNYALNFNTTGFVQCQASFGGIGQNLHTSSTNLIDGKFHTIVWGLQDKSTSYLMIDGEVISTFTPTASVGTNAFGVRMARFLVGKHCDARIYNRYIPPDEARGIVSTRSDGQDLGCVACWRFDDGGSATSVNDYSPTGVDATWTGVLNTDYRWTFSDLGEPEMAGQPYPLTIGNVLNARAHLIDAVRERYRGNVDATGWHTSASNTTLTVKSQGTVLTGGGVDYTAPTNGGDGVFSMTSAEDEPITFDLLNDGDSEENVYPSAVAKSLLTQRTRLTASDLSNVEPTLLLCPWPSGYYTDQDATAERALQEILGGAGMCYFEDPQGRLFFNMLIPVTGYGPYGEPAYDLMGQLNGIAFGDVGGVSSNFTLAGWFKINLSDQTVFNFGTVGFGVGTILLLAKQTAVGNYALFFEAIGEDAGKLIFRSGSISLKTTVGVIQPFTWYFVGCVFDDTNNIMRMYLAPQGGTLAEIASTANSNIPLTNAAPLAIGGNAYSWVSVQHMQVWNSVKSLAQLQALMATPPVGNESGLLAYLPLNEGFDTPREIVSGNVGEIYESTLLQPQWMPKFTVNLDETPSVKLTEFHHTHPVWNAIVKYAKNRFRMSEGDIDAAVSKNDKLFLTSENKSVRFEYNNIRTRFKGSTKKIFDSPITDTESAQKLLRFISFRFGINNYVGNLHFPPGLAISRMACGLQIGDEIGITGNIPSQVQTSLSFKVSAVAPNPLNMSTNVIVWR